MSDAYRDDLDAARARVSDLEREADRLRKRNAELEAREDAAEVQPPPAPAPAPAPEVSATAKFMVSATQVCLVLSLCLVAGPRFHTGPYTPHWVLAGICLGFAFLCWWGSGFRRLWK
jgi:hypothetical protein